MSKQNERLFIGQEEWGVWISCGCDDESCQRQIAVEWRDVRSLGNRLITLAQQLERQQERAQEASERHEKH